MKLHQVEVDVVGREEAPATKHLRPTRETREIKKDAGWGQEAGSDGRTPMCMADSASDITNGLDR